MLPKETIDNDFARLLENKIIAYKEACGNTYDRLVNTETLIRIGDFIDGLKPKSKYRDYKRQILEYLDTLSRTKTYERKEIVAITKEYLSDIFIHLESKHSFVGRHDWFWRGVFSVFIDVLLIITGIAKFYYYLPIFTTFSIIRNISKLKKAKKEGRYIDF